MDHLFSASNVKMVSLLIEYDMAAAPRNSSNVRGGRGGNCSDSAIGHCPTRPRPLYMTSCSLLPYIIRVRAACRAIVVCVLRSSLLLSTPLSAPDEEAATDSRTCRLDVAKKIALFLEESSSLKKTIGEPEVFFGFFCFLFN